MKNFKFKGLLLCLLLSVASISQVWATNASFYNDGAFNLQLYAPSYYSSDTWIGEQNHYVNGNVKELGTITSFYLKQYWFKASKHDGNICTDNGTMKYCVHLTSVDESSASWHTIAKNDQSWDNSGNVTIKKTNADENLLTDATLNGDYVLEFLFYVDMNVSSNSSCNSTQYLKNNHGSYYDQNFKITFSYYPNTAVTFGESSGGTASLSVGGIAKSSGDEITKGSDLNFTASPSTGYQFDGWYNNSSFTGLPISTNTSYTVSSTSTNTYEIYAKFSKIDYTLRYTSNPTNCSSYTDLSTTTYNYEDNVTLSIVPDATHTVASVVTSPETTVTKSSNNYSFSMPASNTTVTVTMAVTAVTVTFDATTNGGTCGTNSKAGTYNTAYGELPIAVKNGYHFKGWYTLSSGGVEVTAESIISTLTGAVTLYAQYDQPSISSISFTPANVLPEGDVTVTTNFADSKNPEGSYSFCYVLTTGSGVAMQVQPDTWDQDGFAVTFTAPATPGSYSVEVRMYGEASHDCSIAGSPVASYTSHATTFTVEAANAVTVEYKCGSVALRSSTTAYATANQTTATISAPEISGLTFDHWNYDGAIITATGGTNYQSNPIIINASSATTLTAVYSQSGYVYFKNVHNWANVYFYRYNDRGYDGGDINADYGIGCHGNSDSWSHYCVEGPVSMQKVSGTDDLYYCKPSSTPTSGQGYAFTDQPSTEYFFGRVPQFDHINVLKCFGSDFYNVNHMIVPNPNEAGTDIGGIYTDHLTYYTQYCEAPSLMSWGWTLRGEWTQNSDWTDESQWFTFSSDKMGSMTFQTKRYFDAANQTKYFAIFNPSGTRYGHHLANIYYNSDPVYIGNGDNVNIGLHTNAPGYYTFTVTYLYYSQTGGFPGNITVSVTYPVVVGDYRLVYTPGGGAHDHPGDVIKKRPNGLDTISLYVASGKSDKIYIQSCTSVDNTSVTWGTATAATYSNSNVFKNDTITKYGPGTYNFIVQQDANGANPTIIKVEKYTGQFYIRTDCVNSDKWNYMDSKEEHIMHYSDYSMTQTTEPYSHYFTKWIAGSNENQTKIRFTVATDYSESISDTLLGDAILGEGEPQVYNTNVRFMYNYNTNALSRAYTQGPTDPLYMILRTPYVAEEGENHAWIYKSWTDKDTYTRFSNPTTLDAVNVDTVRFDDMGNWVYQADVYARPNAPIKLTGNFSGTRYFKGTTGTTYSTTGDSPDAEKLIGGTGDPQHMRIVYDFKTNRMITSWLPPETAISGGYSLEADILLIREHQESADAITFAAGDENKLEDVKKVYGVMKFNKATLNDPTYSRYERDLYWISFPFNVNLSDVFGFGEYGTHWIIERYDGIGRAKKGFWADSEPNWKFITPYQRDSGWVLNANEGYILALDLDELGTTSSVWDNTVSTVYLYFPSSTNLGTIKATSRTVEFPNQSEYKCNIGPRFEGGDDRRIKDSYWHCIGVPSFAGASQSISNVDIDYEGIEHPEEWTANVPFVYKWNSTDNSLSVATGNSSMTFAAMYSYLVQFSGAELSWANVSNTVPASVAARLTETLDREYKLALIREEEAQDHTFVRLTDDASVSNQFEFNYDLCKEYNAGRGNIWTVTADTVEVAGNSMPKPLQMTLVPVGVKVVANGEYTLAMPEGTNGEDVYLIDNAYGTRTNLGLMPYTVTLTAGTYDSRFALEFGPVQDAPTGLENDGLSRSDELNDANDDVRKVFVGGRLYIIRDGKVYDAAGQRIE